MKVKMIKGYNEFYYSRSNSCHTLEDKINNFIKENNIEIKDIKLSATNEKDVSIALIMYEELIDVSEKEKPWGTNGIITEERA